MANKVPHSPIFFLPLVAIILALSGCDQQPKPGIQIGYQPPFVPVVFTIGTNGISIQAKGSIVTEWGTFSIDANVAQTLQPKDNALYVIIRYKHNGVLKDVVYKIETDPQQVTFAVNGTITISKNKVFIDASKGNIKTIEVKGVKPETSADTPTSPSTAKPIPTPAPIPTLTPDPMHGLTIASAANLVIHFYDEKGRWKGWYLMKDITRMTSPIPEDAQMESCVDAQYEYSFAYSPETVQGTDETAFTLQFSGSSWAVVSMDGCTWNASTQTAPPPPSSVAPPSNDQAIPLIKPYFDNSPYWSKGYVLYSVQSLTFRQPIGDHIGACVSYTYAYWDNPNTPVGTDQRKFGFDYANGTWQIDSVDNSYPMGHSSC